MPGAVGYFSPDGAMDSCIVLRTAVLKDGVMHVQAGPASSPTAIRPMSSASVRPRPPR